MGAGETCCIFVFKNPKWYNAYFMATTKWVTCLRLSIEFLMDTCPHIKKKSQLALIGILACSFCGEFSNRHGSRTPSISPQERSPQQTKRPLVLALRSFVTITGAMYRTLALWAGTGVPREWNKTPCAAGCSQAGVSSWPWRAGDVWGQCWRQLPGHGMLPLDNLWQEKVFLPWNREVSSRTRISWSVDDLCLPALRQVLSHRSQNHSIIARNHTVRI